MMLQFGASLLTTLAKARIVNYDHNCSFIVLATVIMVVNYNGHLFIIQATGLVKCNGTLDIYGENNSSKLP